MNLNYSKILDIKCVLADITKKQLANDLGISQMTLSREIKDKNIIESINNYFDSIDPEINKSVNSLIKTATNYETSSDLPKHIQVNDDGSKYIDISKYKEKNEYIRHLEKELEERKQELKESRELIRDLILQPRNKQTGSE
jgi:DNA-binding transcriptional regulator LsrR (DeoR family)